MPDHDALVKVSLGRRTFEFAGSESFVEKMVEQLPTLLSIDVGELEYSEAFVDSHGPVGEGSAGVQETLDAFMERLGINNDTSATRKVGAFVYFLTEISKKPTCTPAQIEECFDLTGLKTPGNLGNAINNAKQPTHGAYIRSGDHGHYAVTTNGKNLVKAMAKTK